MHRPVECLQMVGTMEKSPGNSFPFLNDRFEFDSEAFEIIIAEIQVLALLVTALS